MTSLIDVIFLLLLFFMLSSTFSRFAEIELSSATAGGAPGETRPLFLQLRPERLTLNGEALSLDRLAPALRGQAGNIETPAPLLVSLGDGVTAQRLADLLVVLRGVPGFAPTVLGSGG